MRENLLLLTLVGVSVLFATNTFADETSSGTTSTGTTTNDSTGTTTDTGSTSTGTTSNTGIIWDLRQQIETNKKTIQDNWANLHEDDGYMRDFFETGAVSGAKASLAVRELLKPIHAEVNALIKSGQESIKNSTFDPVVFNVQVDELFSKHIAYLTQYVVEGKLDAFTKFMNEKKAVIMTNKELRKENFVIRKEIKKILTDKQKNNIENKIKGKTLNFYSKLIQKIDLYLSKTTNEKLTAQLEELKDITQTKIDELGK